MPALTPHPKLKFRRTGENKPPPLGILKGELHPRIFSVIKKPCASNNELAQAKKFITIYTPSLRKVSW
jgi:hypothetical protein